MKDKSKAENNTRSKKAGSKGNWFINLIHDKTFQRVIILFLISKILIFGFGTFAQIYYPQDRPVDVVDNWFLNGWAQYDGRAYLSIVNEGYNMEFNGSGNTAWFPLYPLLVKAFGMLLGGTLVAYALAGFILSNVLFIIAMFYLFKLFEEEFNKSVAYKVMAYLLFFPTAYFFSAIYAESLFLLVTVAAFYHANRKEWMLAGIFGFLAAITRTFGVLLFLPFVYMYFQDKKFKWKNIDFDAVWLGLIPLGLICYLAYLWAMFGNPFVFVMGHDKYGRYTSWPWVPFVKSIGFLIQGISAKNIVMTFYQTYNLFMAFLFIAAAWVCYKMKKIGYAIYMLLTILLVLVSASLEGLSREIVVVFPMFIALAHVAQQKKMNSKLVTLMYIGFGILLVVFTLRHLTAYLFPGISIA